MAAVNKSHTPLKLEWFNNCLGDEFSRGKQNSVSSQENNLNKI